MSFESFVKLVRPSIKSEKLARFRIVDTFKRRTTDC